VNVKATGKPYLVIDVHTANRLATKATTTGEQAFPSMTLNGGELAGVPVLVSDQVPAADSNGRKAVLLDATAIAGDAESPMLDASDRATLQLTTNPASGTQNHAQHSCEKRVPCCVDPPGFPMLALTDVRLGSS